MNSTESQNYATEVVYPAAYEAAYTAKQNGATNDEAYNAAQAVAAECVKSNNNCGAVTAANAAYEATVAAVEAVR